MRSVLAVFVAVFGVFAVVVAVIWGVLGRGWSARQADPDPLVSRVFRIRDALGLLIVVAAHLNWQWGAIDAGEVVGGRIAGQGETFVLLMVGVVAVLILFVAVTRKGSRGEALALCTIPLFVGATLGALLFAIFWAFGEESPLLAGLDAFQEMMSQVGSGQWWGIMIDVAVVLGLVLIAALLVTALLTVFAAMLWMVPAGVFRASDVHPMLAPLLMLGLSGWTLVAGIARIAGGADPVFPWWVTIALSIGGPLVVIALTTWQITRLIRSGRGLRTLAYRAADDPVSAAVHRAGIWVRGLFVRPRTP